MWTTSNFLSCTTRRAGLIMAAALACVGSAGECTAQQRPVIKVGTIWAAQHPGTMGAMKFAELAMAKTGNAIDVRVLPNSQLGNEREIFEGIRLGTIEMGYIAGNIIQNAEPSAGLPSLPYLFTGFEQAFKVEDGPVGQEIGARVLRATSTRTLGFFATGFRQIATKKPLRTIDDFKGLKIRVPESPLFVATFRLLGANPTPIPFGELYTALSTNLVEAAESPPAVLDSGKVFEVAKTLVMTSHIYSSGHILISDRLWQTLKPDVQKALSDAAKEAQAYQRALVVDIESKMIDTLKGRGIAVMPIDTAPLQAAVASYYQSFAKEIGGPALIDQAKATR